MVIWSFTHWFDAVTPDTLAKIQFTSGSTNLPKGVEVTHGMMVTNQTGISQMWPFLDENDVVVDWMPWNHTFGGNFVFNMTLMHGGTFYIDHGNPTPIGLPTTIQNIKDISPTIYFGVPRSFTAIYARMQEDETLKHSTLVYWEIGDARVIGLPIPGVKVKLAPDSSGKLELRVKGPNVTVGYYKNEEATRAVFDEEGYYCTGDAGKFLNADDPRTIPVPVLFLTAVLARISN